MGFRVPGENGPLRAQRKFKGFTLIELLIVIAILGILAAAVLIAINPTKRQNQAKDANIKSDVASISTALQAYYTSPGLPNSFSGTYPKDLVTLQTNNDLKSIPVPPGGGAYTYIKNPATCDPTLAVPVACTDVAVYNVMNEDNTQVWCWQSSTGKASPLAQAACTAP